MAYEINQLTISLPNTVDLSNSQFCAVAVDANGNAVLPAAGGIAIGVLQNNPKANQTASVRVAGISYLVASAAITAGSPIAVDATGKAKAVTAETANTTTGVTTGSAVFGVALDTTAAAGDILTVLIGGRGAVPGTFA